MVILIAKVTVKEGAQKAFLDAARPCIEATHKEEGNISYTLYPDLDSSVTFTFVEEWKGQAELGLHSKSPHFLAFSKAMADIAAAPMEMKLFSAEKVN